ncbi:MAG: hypothetical protein ACREEB_11540, partial [Caulobacteraceae bacterium]
MKRLIASLAGLILAGQANADTVAIACGAPSGAGETQIVFNTEGWARVETPHGLRQVQARVTDNEVDFDVDRQPYQDIRYQIDRRTGAANLTIFSYLY